MKRVLKWALVIVPIIVIVLLVVFVFSLGAIVKSGVEGVLPKVVGAPVKLDKVSLSPFSGKGTLSGFIIGNPEGFKTDHAFALGSVRVEVDILSLFSDHIIIREIYIDEPQVTYEVGLDGSNIGKMQENIREFAGPAEEEPEAEPEEEKPGKGKQIQIDHFVFKNGKVSLSTQLLEGRRLTAPIPDIELNDIGKGGGSIAEVSQAISAPVTGAVDTAAEKLRDMAGRAADEAGKAGKEALDTGKKTIDDAGKSIGDLFP